MDVLLLPHLLLSCWCLPSAAAHAAARDGRAATGARAEPARFGRPYHCDAAGHIPARQENSALWRAGARDSAARSRSRCVCGAGRAAGACTQIRVHQTGILCTNKRGLTAHWTGEAVVGEGIGTVVRKARMASKSSTRMREDETSGTRGTSCRCRSGKWNRRPAGSVRRPHHWRSSKRRSRKSVRTCL